MFRELDSTVFITVLSIKRYEGTKQICIATKEPLVGFFNFL